jgi:hypothetical protein
MDEGMLAGEGAAKWGVARHYLEEGLDFHRRVSKSNPYNLSFTSDLAWMCINVAKFHLVCRPARPAPGRAPLEARQHLDEAREHLGKLTDARRDFNDWYNLALVEALTGEMTGPNAAGREPAANRHARRAVELLRRAVGDGYRTLPSPDRDIRHDIGFRSLRQREDFQSLLRDLSKGSSGGAERAR